MPGPIMFHKFLSGLGRQLNNSRIVFVDEIKVAEADSLGFWGNEKVELILGSTIKY